MAKIDPNALLWCATVLLGLIIIFGYLTMNSRWNLEAKCRVAAEKAVAEAMKQ